MAIAAYGTAGAVAGARPEAYHTPMALPNPVRQAVLAAVIRRGDAYLLARRPAHKRHGGLWEFPGGKLEPGESWKEAAERELREELGVEVRTVGDPIFRRTDPGSPFEIVFVPVEIEGEPQPLEHDELRWVPLTGMRDLELAPTDHAFVDFLSSAS